MRAAPTLALYLAASRLGEPVARLWLARRARRGLEDPARLGERLGHAGAARPAGRLVWIHGASLGESLAARPLIEALGRRDGALSFLVTSGTLAAARHLPPRLPPAACHQFAPLDAAGPVRRFLDHWRPDLGILLESELWPRLILEARRRGMPLALCNARLSPRSFRRWRGAPGMAAQLLGSFALVHAQDEAAAGRLRSLGLPAERLRMGGTLKALVPPPPANAAALADARRAIGDRPAWLALSTHAPEEEIAAEAHRRAAAEHPRLLTIIAPRRPERGEAIAAALARRGLRVAPRSAGEQPGAGTDVWLADTLGEAGLWLRLAPLVFVGGTLAPVGGHSPLEAAALGAAILHGPATDKAGAVFEALERAGAARRVADGAALGAAVAELLATPEACRRMGAAARAALPGLAPDIDALADELLGLMERAE